MTICNFSGDAGAVPESWRHAKGWLNQLVQLLFSNLKNVDISRTAPDGTLPAAFSALWSPCTPPNGGRVVVLSSPPKEYVWDGADWIDLNPSIGGVPVGTLLIRSGTLPGGYLWANGQTIGDATSGSTAWANANALALYEHVWDTYSNTVCPIYTNAGAPTTRGASADADFNAHKRLALPDVRGYVMGGLDDMGGVGSAGRITNAQADINGGVMGAEFHVISLAEMYPHSHGVSLLRIRGAGGPYASATRYEEINDPSVGSFDAVADVATAPGNFSSPLWESSAGSGQAHNNTQPTSFQGVMIKT